MSVVNFPRGALIIRENEADFNAYIILAGRVEVFKGNGPSKRVIATLGKGQVFGEIGLILEKNRTASVVALEPTRLRRIDQRLFSRFLSREPEKVLPLLKMLFERFRMGDAEIVEISGALAGILPAPQGPRRKAAASPGDVPAIRGLTPRAEEALKGFGGALRPELMPLRIGRATRDSAMDIFTCNDLQIEDESPFWISRNHCLIDRGPAGGLRVLDRGSRLGCLVNGLHIGNGAVESEAPLDRGRNELVLGGTGSPFRFEILVPR